MGKHEEDAKGKSRTLQAINEGDKKREKGSRKETGRPCALEEEAKKKSQTLQVVNEGDTKKGVVK